MVSWRVHVLRKYRRPYEAFRASFMMRVSRFSHSDLTTRKEHIHLHRNQIAQNAGFYSLLNALLGAPEMVSDATKECITSIDVLGVAKVGEEGAKREG